MHAFAAIRKDGSVVTWGEEESGGDSSKVQAQLQHVQEICGADCAFSAVLFDGSVVTWGDEAGGADSSHVQKELFAVKQVVASSDAFAAVRLLAWQKLGVDEVGRWWDVSTR